MGNKNFKSLSTNTTKIYKYDLYDNNFDKIVKTMDINTFIFYEYMLFDELEKTINKNINNIENLNKQVILLKNINIIFCVRQNQLNEQISSLQAKNILLEKKLLDIEIKMK